MTNLAVEVLALESAAEHVTAVRPIGNRLPDRGAHATGLGPSTLSLPVTAYVTRTRLAPSGSSSGSR